MINKNLRYTDTLPSFGNVSDEFYSAVKEQLVVEGIYPDSDCIPKHHINRILESWARVYGAGYADGQHALHRSAHVDTR